MADKSLITKLQLKKLADKTKGRCAEIAGACVDAIEALTGSLSKVATSGSYNDLSNKPTIPAAYKHPGYTTKASGLYKVNVDATGHVSEATAVVKDDITALGIPSTNTTYEVASSSANGLMSSSDKSKLDNITKTNTVTLTASSWSSSAPYTQTVNVSGITANSVPEVYLSYPSTITTSNADTYVESYSCIHKVETLSGQIKVTCYTTKPTMDLQITLKGV